MVDWTETLGMSGIRSIICLMHTKELSYYTSLDLGLPILWNSIDSEGLKCATSSGKIQPIARRTRLQ